MRRNSKSCKTDQTKRKSDSIVVILTDACIVGQCGGQNSFINASSPGVIQSAFEHTVLFSKIYKTK